MKRETKVTKIFTALIALFALAALAAGCGGGGGGAAAGGGIAPTPPVVVVVQTQFPVSGIVSTVIADGSMPKVAAAQVELMNGNTVVATTTTDADGLYNFNSVATGTYKLRVTPTNASTQRFVAKTTASYAVAATETVHVSVTAAYRVDVSAVNSGLATEYFTGANVRLACAGYTVDQAALNGQTSFIDMPLAGGCTVSVTNPATTTPKMVTDAPASASVDVVANVAVTISAAKPVCVIDADCPIPLGMTTPVCLDAGTTASSCAAY